MKSTLSSSKLLSEQQNGTGTGGKGRGGGQERANGRAPSSKHRVRMNGSVKVECDNMNNSYDLTIIV